MEPLRSGIRRTRIAHPTHDLEAVREFYGVTLGLRPITSFVDHDGYNGLIYRLPGANNELEFTLALAPHSKVTWSEETLLVFYIETESAFDATVEALDRLPAARVASANPYWDRGGVTFLDPDGRRVVIFHSEKIRDYES